MWSHFRPLSLRCNEDAAPARKRTRWNYRSTSVCRRSISMNLFGWNKQAESCYWLFVSFRGLGCRCRIKGQTNQQIYDSSTAASEKDRTVISWPHKGFLPPLLFPLPLTAYAAATLSMASFDAPRPYFLGAFSGRKHYRLYWSLDSFCLGVKRPGLITWHGWSAALWLSGQQSGLK